MSDPTIFISAGEASGEHYGALLIDELRNQLSALGAMPPSSAWAARAWSRRASTHRQL